METIKLKVTSKVINQTREAIGQEQIAVTSPEGALAGAIALARKDRRVRLRLADAITLELGDTGAIWRRHNSESAEAFDSLYGFLSRHPDTEFQFVCCVEG